MSEKCVICELPLSGTDVITVKERGIQRLLHSSREREDRKEELFQGKTQIEVHRKCRLLYIEEKSVLACKKRNPLLQSTGEQTFDFKTCCLFCEEIADEETAKAQVKYPEDKRIIIAKIKRKETQAKILEAASAHDDEWSLKVVRRITGVNLNEENAVYHSHCYQKFCHPYRATGLKRGRPQSSENVESMERIFSFLETNEDCQFSLGEIRNALPQIELPSDQVIKYNLKKKYGEDIIISSGHPSVVCFLKNSVNVIQKSWSEARNKDDIAEKYQTVDAAANIVAVDVRSKICDTEMYPPPNGFLSTASDSCPETLLRFLKTIIMHNKKDNEMYEKKCIAIAHAIMSAARPRSFKSPVLLGLSALIHHKYASRYLIDLLSGLGFCSTYDETLKLQVSAIASYAPKPTSPNFTQFVFDNADVNVQTIDGHNTFHTMGCIQCLNPPQTLSMDDGIPRLNYIPKSFMKRFDQVPMKTYIKPAISGLSKVAFQPSIKNDQSLMLTFPDLLWMYGKSQGFPDVPGLNTFITYTTKERIEKDQMTEVKPLPFINNPASNYDTILTALQFARAQCKLCNMECCIVTFDQPLYQKAQEIVKSSQDPEINNIILRLGGFHLIMSFMGAVGTIMNGSGLKEWWASIFALGSLDKVLSGHHYERAVRAHVLSSLALFDLIIREADLTLDEKLELESAIHDLTDRKQSVSDMDTDLAQTIIEKHNAALKNLEEKGNTAKLWFTYYKTTMLIQQFIKAERTGDWVLHIETIKAMMPYFLSANHFNYGKSASLYIQDMENLEKIMSPEDYEKFVTQKLFTIRRTNKPCSGTWSDMTIEQSLMRSMKTAGGVTQGRGLSDNVLGRWILGLPILHHITEAVENFCDATDEKTIPKHKDGSVARMERDAKDLNSLKEWLNEHPPFPETPDIMSLSSGLTGDASINPHMAREVGNSIMQSREGISFNDLKFSRKEAIKSLATLNAAVTIYDTKVPIEPDQIFKRISFLKKSQDELKEHLKFELSPYPLSLFDQKGMRKTAKSAFYEMFGSTPPSDVQGSSTDDAHAHVIDGGFLLHRVVWQKGLAFGIICQKYVEYVKKFSNPTVVFDGYQNQECVKNQERLRRSRRKLYPDIIFQEETECNMSQEHFLSNDKNKSRLIEMLTKKLIVEKIPVTQSKDDADTLIVCTAIEIADSYKYEKVVIVGEDVDLLTILTTTKKSNIVMMKPGKGKIPSKLYNADSFKGDPETAALAHAFTGCDSTSAIFKQGKKKACSKIIKNQDLKNTIKVFSDPCATPEQVSQAGEQLFCELYGGKSTNLDALRYERFAQCITKSSVDLATLPPTSSAAKQHSLRVYYQVQKWLFNDGLGLGKICVWFDSHLYTSKPST